MAHAIKKVQCSFLIFLAYLILLITFQITYRLRTFGLLLGTPRHTIHREERRREGRKALTSIGVPKYVYFPRESTIGVFDILT